MAKTHATSPLRSIRTMSLQIAAPAMFFFLPAGVFTCRKLTPKHSLLGVPIVKGAQRVQAPEDVLQEPKMAEVHPHKVLGP